MLQVDKIQRLTERIKAILNPECSYSASIVTNGYLLTPEVAETLAACDVKMAQITLDGSRKDHDSRRFLRNGQPTYDAILDNVSKVTHLLDISIRCNVDAHNIAGAGDLLMHSRKRALKTRLDSIWRLSTILTIRAQVTVVVFRWRRFLGKSWTFIVMQLIGVLR